MDRDAIVTEIKILVTRQPADIDTTLVALIHTAVELFGTEIESIFDESVWKHVYTSDDATNEVNNWLLPPDTKKILSAAHVDVSGTEDLEIPMAPTSPKDLHRIGEIVGSGRSEPSTFPSNGWSWDIGRINRSGRGTYKRAGRPCAWYRVNDNIYVYPRPDADEVGNRMEMFITTKPAALTAGDSTNIITEKYPRQLIHYVAALAWFHYGNDQRGNVQLQIAAKLLESFTTQQERSKLFSQNVQYMGKR